jgi:arginine/lysine/ornithine decarboxylase
MASLDAARQQATTPGAWQQPLAAAEAARSALAALPGVILVQQGGGGEGGRESVAAFDPLRLVVNVSQLGLTGYAAAEWLEQHYSIVAELATAQVGGGKLLPYSANIHPP